MSHHIKTQYQRYTTRHPRRNAIAVAILLMIVAAIDKLPF